MSELSIKSLHKRYPNGYEAIKSADIDIQSGEFTVFVGPSGCGKSTLLRMIAGLEDVTSGSIALNNREMTSIEPANRNIAMVFQNYALYPHMTVFKNLAYGLVNRKIPKDEIERRVKEASEMLQLEEYLDRKPNELSGGQRQRVAMGRAIVREPDLFLFDEPLSNLDAKLRQKMRIEIKSLQQRLGITSVYVTHDQVEAMTMADKIVVINKGEIEQVDTPQGIYHNPNSVFVATFMGAPPMNILPATLTGKTVQLDDDTSFQLPSLTAEPSTESIKMGIRPEKIKIDSSTEEDRDSLLARIQVNVVEDLGAHRLVHSQLCGHDLTLITDKSGIHSGDELSIQLPLNDICFFDGLTDKRLP